MSLNKQKGNMYGFVDYTWNPIRGHCPHDCEYCYMKGFKVGELRLEEKCLSDGLDNKAIFVGSSTDMFAEDVPKEWIAQVLTYCRLFPKSTFYFQSKNPVRFSCFAYPPHTYLGTTLESNRAYRISKAPEPWERASALALPFYKNFVSIEPVMDFDLEIFVRWIEQIEPEFVSIGADSKGHDLPEPGGEKVQALIAALEEFTEVRPKKNLERLMNGRD